MKIAVTATGPTLDSQVENQFGRTSCFIIIDPESMEYQVIQNPNAGVGDGTGIQSAQLLSGRDIDYILTGNCGPNVFYVFEAAGINLIVDVTGTVRKAVENFKSGAFSVTSQPNVANHFGKGRGLRPGIGTGAGRNSGIGSGSKRTGRL
jgi:predicted Fe-Mo cluster-binding NifX family protein